MAQGNEIIVNPGINGPHGRIEPGIVSGTPKPGTCMQIKAATAAVDGKFTFEVYNLAADGQPAPVVVLLADTNQYQGKTVADALVSGEPCNVYWPQVGDELNMLVADPGGAVAIGDKFVIDDGTGKLVAAPNIPADYTFTEDSLGGADGGEVSDAVNANRRAITFQAMEAIADPNADVLLHCRCIRNC